MIYQIIQLHLKMLKDKCKQVSKLTRKLASLYNNNNEANTYLN
jgi:hypothetical protein